jgi:hypothetical protein
VAPRQSSHESWAPTGRSSRRTRFAVRPRTAGSPSRPTFRGLALEDQAAALHVQADQLAGGDQHSSGACRLDRPLAVASVARTSIIEGRGRDRLVLRATTPHRQHSRVRCPNGRRDRVGHRPTRIHFTWASIWRAECRGRTIAADDGRAETRAVGEQLRECGCGDSQPWRQPGSSNLTRTAVVPTGVSRRPSLTWRR